jgi:predicted nucleic acid-binding protein
VIAREFVFIDASVWLAAAGSVTGGSSKALGILEVSETHKAATSDAVLSEVDRNLRRKFGEAARLRFDSLLAAVRPRTINVLNTDPLPDLPAALAGKDRHIVQAWLALGATICLTLDRRDLLKDDIRAWAAARGVRMLSPCGFLADVREQGTG